MVFIRSFYGTEGRGFESLQPHQLTWGERGPPPKRARTPAHRGATSRRRAAAPTGRRGREGDGGKGGGERELGRKDDTLKGEYASMQTLDRLPMSDTPLIATAIITAAGTTGLAVVGAISMRQGREMIRAASDEAKASNDLVTETRKDRELQWQPVPSVSWPRHVVGAIGNADIHVQNSGGGPAISMRYVGRLDPLSSGWMSKSIDVPVGQFVELQANLPLDLDLCMRLMTWKGEDGLNHNSESIGAVFAKDILGNRYRFIVVKDRHSQPIIERSERWHPGEVTKPQWAKCRDIWPDYGVEEPK